MKEDFSDSEPIMDSIYGIINISQFEKNVISTKEMQRLRGIKQLGFVNLVYPAAEHSRFSHSLGVMHQAKTMIKYVNDNLKNKPRYQTWINKNKQQTDTSPEKEITKIEKIVISAAALLHDLPHSPFSHEIETPENKNIGIPVHDDFENNPAFFMYLFNTSKSDLAEIINIYNKVFLELVKEDNIWKKILTINTNDIDKDGYVKISDQSKILQSSSLNYEKLPLLGVMIFELLLFDKNDKWIKVLDTGKITSNIDGINVVIDYEKNIINWKPIKDWFRPYRKDIVADTICADLLDYLMRDGRNTGLFPSLDLKFFDRMTIAKAIPDKTNTFIPLKEIPDFCEHIVFDIYDQKRGIIRQSIITEIIAFLQQRYLLAERVYNHRVVEAARSMLQEASYLLVHENAITANELHDTKNEKGAPINDDSLFYWILSKDAGSNKTIKKAQKLVKMIQERRIYRELVIIDGILGHHYGTFRGDEVSCKTLADALLDKKNRENIIKVLNDTLNNYFTTKGKNINYPMPPCPNPLNEQLFTIGVRKFGKRYKIPRVLVARPITYMQEDDIETFPLFEGKKLPSVSDRLEAMQLAYDSLWKVYLFIHPYFHYDKFIDLHKELAETFVDELYKITNIKWDNSIENYTDLLPKEPIDVSTFILENTKQIVSESNKGSIMKIVNEINNTLNIKLDNKKIAKSLEGNNMNDSLSEKNQKQIINDFINNYQSFYSHLPIAAKEGKEKQIQDDLIKLIKSTISNGLF